MKTLLVCVALVASVLADEAPEAQKVVLPALYGHPWPYPYATHHHVAYTLPSPIQYKYVPKEVEFEIKTYNSNNCMNKCLVLCQYREARKVVLPALYGHPWAYPYAAHYPVAYTVPTPIQYKEEEIEIKTYQRNKCYSNCASECK